MFRNKYQPVFFVFRTVEVCQTTVNNWSIDRTLECLRLFQQNISSQPLNSNIIFDCIYFYTDRFKSITSVMLIKVKYLVMDWPTETWSKLRVASDETPWSASTKICGYLAEADKFIVLNRLREVDEFPPYLQMAFPLYVIADLNKSLYLNV